MSGLNRVQLIGRLGADPESRAMPNGNNVTNLRLATSERWKDRDSGEAREHTEWHTITIFGRLGEVAQQYLEKGVQVYLEGKMRTEKWTDKEGRDRYTTKVIADSMVMLGKANAGGEKRDQGDVRPAAGAGTHVAEKQQKSASATEHDFDDSIPF